MILFLKEVKKPPLKMMLNLNPRAKRRVRLVKRSLSKRKMMMILMPNQYWRSAAAVIAFAPIHSLKDIPAAFVCQLNAVPYQSFASLYSLL
jgi:hypothetical protein